MQKYTKIFSSIHWVHAVIIVMLISGGFLSLPELPKSANNLAQFKSHMILGFIATILTIIRLIMLKKQPTLPPLNMSSARDILVKWNHRLIYIFLLITGFSGAATTKSANVGQVIIFGKDPSVYKGIGSITQTLSNIHTISATILLVLIAMHIVGVISYIIKSKENILKRVWF